jgi:2-hydroxychromene-2-carboxylate isomerase
VPERGPIRFYFDYISHNAYVAWTQLGPLAERHGRGVEVVPVLFAGLLGAYDQMGPAEVPPKNWWMIKNLIRKAALLGVPFAPPPSHPFHPLLALRATWVPMPEAERQRLVDGLFRAVWAGGGGATEPERIAGVARAAGLDGERIVREAGTAAVKRALRSATDGALAAGVFGVPSMLVDAELFFGYDDFPFLERFLAGEDPLDPSVLPAWRALRPSVQRKR